MQVAIIEVNGVTKKFGRFTALDNIRFTVNEGQICGFIGPNGAGKTTTLRILLGLLKATKGEAKIFGLDAWKDAVEIHKRVSYVPGDVNLWPNLTGGEVIDLFLKMRGNGDKKKRNELVERFDLDPSKKCRTYSKGNRQKVALIAALACDADLYIFDEPTSGLDPLMENVFQECIREARTEGKSVLLSSHILSEVEKVCDHIVIIRKGKIIETGSLDEMRHLTRNKITLQTKTPVSGLKGFPGVHHLIEENSLISFQVDTEHMDEVIRHISQFGILKLECVPPTLEDLFMRHYQRTEAPDRGGDLS